MVIIKYSNHAYYPFRLFGVDSNLNNSNECVYFTQNLFCINPKLIPHEIDPFF